MNGETFECATLAGIDCVDEPQRPPFVLAVYRDRECEFLNLPLTGVGGRLARNRMNFYNRRLRISKAQMGDWLLR